jgi:DNA polymerase III subunit epsilon
MACRSRRLPPQNPRFLEHGLGFLLRHPVLPSSFPDREELLMPYFDTETTGLLLPQAAPLNSQPYIVELCIIQDDGSIFHTLVKPPIPIPAEVTRIHGVDDGKVASAPPFAEIAPFVIGLLRDQKVSAYNASFDANVLRYELKRLGLTMPSIRWHDPMHDAQMNTGKRWKQADLYAALTGQKMINAHNALADTQALKVICETLAAKSQRI